MAVLSFCLTSLFKIANMKITLIFTGACLLMYIGYKIFLTYSVYENVKSKYKQGAVILDVRAEAEFKTGHIDSAVNISLGTLRKRSVELDTGKTYITCCSHGLRSVKAESILKERGFKHVYNGGAWVDLQEIIKK